ISVSLFNSILLHCYIAHRYLASLPTRRSSDLGERGSDRKHIETSKFKKQTLEKEIDFLEKNLAVKKDEWTAYSDKVKSDLEVPAKRHMKSVEVPTGEKSMFG